MSGGKREGAGRKPVPVHLKKVPYNTKLPQWLKDWLTDPKREKSGPMLIEIALRESHKLEPPDGGPRLGGGDAMPRPVKPDTVRGFEQFALKPSESMLISPKWRDW